MPPTRRPEWNIYTRMVFYNLLNQCCPDPVEDKDPPDVKDPREEESRNNLGDPKIYRRCPVIIKQEQVIPSPSSSMNIHMTAQNQQRMLINCTKNLLNGVPGLSFSVIGDKTESLKADFKGIL